MSVLVPCPSCSRHVRASEGSCPFCASLLPADLASRAVPSTTRRLDRLATFTFAAALAVTSAGVGCSASSDGSDDGQQQDSQEELRKRHKDAGAADSGHHAKDAGCVVTVEEDPGGMVAMYGMPVPTPTPTPCAKDAGTVRDGGGFHAMYGMPPVFVEDGGGFHALYGMPRAPDDGT